MIELYDLNSQILESIFTAELSHQVVGQYTEWHQNLDPSYKYIRHMLEDYLVGNHFKMLKIGAQNLTAFFGRINNFKLPRTFLRGYLSIIQQHIEVIQGIINHEEMTRNWRIVSIEILEEYLSAFSIELQGSKVNYKSRHVISASEIEQKLTELIEKKDYDSAIRLIQLINYSQRSLQMLFTHMANNKEASKAANYIKTHKLDSKLFPLINKKLNKSMIRYFLNSVGWDAAEDIFQGQSEALWNLIQDLLDKKKIKEAKSIWWRNKELLQSDIKGLSKQTLAALKEWRQESFEHIKESYIQNAYFQDYFGPSDNEKFLSLQSFGIRENQIYFLTSKEDYVDQFISTIESAKECAIDTESIVGKTKLDRQKDEPPSIIQVAFPHEVYVIDCGNHHKRVKEAFLRYLSSDKLLLGHALENDLEAVLMGLGLSKQQRRMFKFGNVVDTCKLFKAIYPNEKHSNLAYISLKVLGKEICKKQTLTNWSRRPLRRNQLHYAALDALIVIHIYRRLEESVGINMITYFLEEM